MGGQGAEETGCSAGRDTYRQGRTGLLDLILTDEEELVSDVQAGSSLVCGDHEMVEFRVENSK